MSQALKNVFEKIFFIFCFWKSFLQLDFAFLWLLFLLKLIIMDLNESFDSNASLTDEIPEFNLPEDLSFERKFIITAGKYTLYRSLLLFTHYFYLGDIKSLIVLAHPKSGSPAYYSVSGEELSELLSLDLNGRSALYGNTVIREAKLYLNAPVHPFLLLLPYLYNKVSRFT